MAETTDLTRALDLHLLAVEDMLKELPEVAATWDELPENHQAAWPLEWDQAMALLELVDEANHRGELTPAQQARYRAVVRGLCAAEPLIARLRLSPTTVPLNP